MSLQVWIPCDGDLKNRGLAGDFTLNGNPVFGDGIVTKQSAFLNQRTYWYTTPALNGVTNFSVCAWIKIDSTAEFTDWSDIIRVQSKTGDTTDVMRFEFRNQSNTALIGYFATYIVKDKAITTTNANSYWPIGTNYDYAKDKWCHLVLTKNHQTCSLYVNGVFKASAPCTSFENSPQTLTGHFGLGNADTHNTPAWVNDFRIYDHCMSAKEVAELAKGLVTHYTLSSTGGENLIIDTFDYDKWTKSANVQFVNGSTTKIIQIQEVETDTWRAAFPFKRIPYSTVRNKTVTCSCYVKASKGSTAYVNFNLSLYQVISNGSRLRWKDPLVNFTGTGDWQFISGTYNITDDFFSSGTASIDLDTCYFTCNFYGKKTVPFDAKEFKVELGNKSTPWTINASDTIYSKLGYNDNTEYDATGFKHNANLVNSPKYSSDTARYFTSIIFNGSNQCIQNVPVFPMDNFTVAFWFKRNATTNSRQFMFTAWNGISCELDASNKPFFRITSTGDTPLGTAITVDTGWVFYCGVYIKATSMELFINGVSVGKKASTTLPNISATTGNIGMYSNNYFNGQMSDFRIYATALSADDIMELYKTSASLSNNGVLFTHELIEG